MAAENRTFSINQSPVSLNNGDKLTFKLVLKGTTTSNFTASLSEGSLLISSLAAATGYASTTCPYFNSASISASFAAGQGDIITFSGGISNFHDNNYQFIPNPLTGSQNSLYSVYGDVDYPFYIKPYDIVLTYLSDGTYIESRILQVTSSNNLLQIQLDTQLSNAYRNDLSSGSYQRFLLLTRIEDETNAYLTFPKRIGQTSYGLVIPSNIHPDVLANIDAITENVKRRLIESGEIVA
jgi:hypothetical protein